MDEWIEKVLRETGYGADGKGPEKFRMIANRYKAKGAVGDVTIPREICLASIDHDKQIMKFIKKEIDQIEGSVLRQLDLMNAPDTIIQYVQRLIVLANVTTSRNTTPTLVLKKALKET